ncbi:hypothetical protein V6N11_018759 [Hibiscus sabdariffa]|uniref:Uncharacterized protein n=1 Tax=Hibiscus sabdariffa TaxID=183260 RepID=A0ABR2QTD2_9ROSI
MKLVLGPGLNWAITATPLCSLLCNDNEANTKREPILSGQIGFIFFYIVLPLWSAFFLHSNLMRHAFRCFFRIDTIFEVSTPLHRGRQDLVVDQSEVTCISLLSSGAIVKVSTPLLRGRQDLVIDQSEGRRNYQGVHSTPLHRGRHDLAVDQSEGRHNCQGVHSTPLRETGLGYRSIYFAFPSEDKTCQKDI